MSSDVRMEETHLAMAVKRDEVTSFVGGSVIISRRVGVCVNNVVMKGSLLWRCLEQDWTWLGRGG